MSIKPTNPYEYHIIEENAIVPKLSFSPEIDFNQQKTRIKRKFLELINIPDKKNKSYSNYRVHGRNRPQI